MPARTPNATWVFARVFLPALLALLTTACGPSPTRLDRIGPPVRFGQLRETAAWLGAGGGGGVF